MFGVVLDACVLVPAPLRDTLLILAEHRFFQPHWCEEILSETNRTLVGKIGLSQSRADYATSAVRAAFPEALVKNVDGIRIADDSGVDRKDHHVLITAILSQSQIIVTFNLRHFPAEDCAPLGVEVQHPDRFLVHQFHLDPQAITALLHHQAAELGNPPMTIVDILDNLTTHAPEFCSLVADHLSKDIRRFQENSNQ